MKFKLRYKKSTTPDLTVGKVIAVTNPNRLSDDPESGLVFLGSLLEEMNQWRFTSPDVSLDENELIEIAKVLQLLNNYKQLEKAMLNSITETVASPTSYVVTSEAFSNEILSYAWVNAPNVTAVSNGS